MAIPLARWADSFPNRQKAMSVASWALAAMLLLGFALRASHEHRLLRDRDGARPFYDPRFVQRSIGLAKGLLWVDTDHAFNLAHDPSVSDPNKGLVVARLRSDDHDRLLWEHLGRPRSWRYIFHPWDKADEGPRLESWSPTAPDSTSYSFEAEVEWPPLEQSGGYAVPTYLAPGSCVSSGKALALIRTSSDSPACASVDVPVPASGAYELRPWLVLDGDASVSVEYLSESAQTQSWVLPARLEMRNTQHERSILDNRFCVGLEPKRIIMSLGTRAKLRICSNEPWIALDRVVLSPVN
jgi:hypothetical protein